MGSSWKCLMDFPPERGVPNGELMHWINFPFSLLYSVQQLFSTTFSIVQRTNGVNWLGNLITSSSNTLKELNTILNCLLPDPGLILVVSVVYTIVRSRNKVAFIFVSRVLLFLWMVFYFTYFIWIILFQEILSKYSYPPLCPALCI